MFNMKKKIKNEIVDSEKDIKTILLKRIKEAHSVTRGTFNHYSQLTEMCLNLQQVVVSNGEKITQHLVKIYIEGCPLAYIDYTDIDLPVFYEITDGELNKSENQNIDFYIKQI